jgi:peptidyl-prolyl cis-trans isomerase SurA
MRLRLRGAPKEPMTAMYSSIRLAFVFMLAAMATVLAGAAVAATAIPVDRIVAVVNSEAVTGLELRDQIQEVVAQLRRQDIALPPEDVLQRQVLERMILERLQVQQANETGIKVDDATLERAIERISENNKLTAAQMRSAIEHDGMDWNGFRERIRREILVARLREREVDSRVVVTDAEIDNFLANNPDAASGEEFNLAHILLRAPEAATPEDIAKLRARAEDVLSRLAAGEDFAKLAATYSDAQDATSGGALGWRSADRVPGLFAEAVRNMQPGEVSPVLRSAAGLHIVKLLGRRGGAQDGAKRLEQTHARHILLKTSEVVTDAEAEHRLLALRERIVNGTDFGELAQANSADLSAAKGGDLGWISPGDTVPEFERAMNALKPGEVSQPVQSPFGWHLIQVIARRVEDVTEAQKRNAVRAALRQRKADEAYQAWLRQLRDRSFVQYRLDEP